MLIFFKPVNPELGIIPISTTKIFKNRILDLNNPGKELNVNKIHRANFSFEEKKKIYMYIDMNVLYIESRCIMEDAGVAGTNS